MEFSILVCLTTFCIIIIVGACYLECTIKTICIGPIIQWPNPRMAKQRP